MSPAVIEFEAINSSPECGSSAMSAKRFHPRWRWALIPGPTDLAQPMSSLDLQDVTLFSPAEIVESFLCFPGIRLLHAAAPSWWQWSARWKAGDDFIEIGMTLFEDEAQSWGGSPITANCSLDAIESLWSHLQARHRGIWLHDPDCVIHTPDSFRRTTVA
jgi:hypothetical protein